MEHGTQAFNPYHMHEEFREFVGAGCQCFGLFAQHRVIRKQFWIKHPPHGRTRARGHNNVLGIGKQGEVTPGDVFGWLPKARIERRLSATRLAEREVNSNAQTMQQTHSGFAHLRIKHITQACDKQGYTRWS